MKAVPASLLAVVLALLVLDSDVLPAIAAATGPAAMSPVALRARAAAGDAQAQYDYASVLLCGAQVERDPGEAARWMALAAEQDHSGAQSVLGWMRMTGTGVPRDDGMAVHWLRRAAERRDTAAQNNLGVLYATGRGVGRDFDAASRWFSAAADQGAADAARNLDVLRGAPGSGARTASLAAVHPALAAANCQPWLPARPRQP